MKKWLLVIALVGIVVGCFSKKPSDKAASTPDEPKVAAAAENKEATPKKKGLFSRMFGKKKADKPAETTASNASTPDRKPATKPASDSDKEVTEAPKKKGFFGRLFGKKKDDKKAAENTTVTSTETKPEAKPAEKAKTPAPSPAPSNGKPIDQAEKDALAAKDPKALLDVVARKQSIEEQEGAVAARHYTEAGKRLYNSFKYEEAKEQFGLAIKADPSNDEARDYYERTMGLLGERIDKVKTTAEWLRQEKVVRIQEIKSELEYQLQKAMQAYSQKRYGDSKKLLENIVERLRWLPSNYTSNMEDISVRANRILVEVKKGLEYRESRDKIESDQKAKALAQRKYYLEQNAHNKKVQKLLIQIEDFMAVGEYGKAQRLALKVLQIDPLNQRAKILARNASDLEYQAIVDRIVDLHKDKHRRSIENIRNAAIPYDKLLVYPDDWDQITQREGENLQKAQIEPWELDIKKKMAMPVSFNFDQTPIQNVIEFMRVATGVNIILDQNALVDEDTGDTRDIPISLQVSNMEATIALDWILKLSNLKSILKDQAVYVSTEADVAGDVVLQLYDIRDLTLSIADFPGPDISLHDAGGDGAVGAEFEDAEEDESVTPDTLVELIQSNVAPDSWEEDGVAIGMQAGKMLVSQKPTIHKQIIELLAFFRRAKALQVNIDSRFITINDDLAEEMGMSWGDDVGGGEGTFDDFTAGNGTRTQSGFADQDNNEQLTFYDLNNPVATSTTLGNAGGFNMFYSFLNDPKVSFLIKAMQKTSRGTILSSPSITLTNTQRGHIIVADQRSYIRDWDQGDGGLDPQIGSFQVGTVLDVRPIVSADKRYVTLEMRPGLAEELPNSPRISSASFGGPTPLIIELPQLTVRSVKSTVTLPDKGTISLGGRLTARESHGRSGMPLISNIPFLGRLFSNYSHYDENTSIMILATAEIIMFSEYEAELEL